MLDSFPSAAYPAAGRCPRPPAVHRPPTPVWFALQATGVAVASPPPSLATALRRCVDRVRRSLPRPPWLEAHAQTLAIFLLALIVRVTDNLTIARGYVPTHDASEYVLLGQRLSAGACYCLWGAGHPTAYRDPGFPLFLAAIFTVFGVNTLVARLALSVVGSATCVITSQIARDLFAAPFGERLGARVALIAGLVAATYPQLFINDAWLYSESLATFLFAASCLVVMRVVRRPPDWRWAAVGALLGLTALTRPNGVYALAAALLWFGFALARRWIDPKRATLATALLLVGFVAVVTPWAARNAVVTGGAFVPFTTGAGIVIAGAYTDAAVSGPDVWQAWINPWRNPTWDAHDRAALASFPADCWGRCEVERDQATTAIGLGWARTHVGTLPWLVVLRFIQFWTPANGPDEAGLPIVRPLAVGYPALVIAAAMLGLFTLRRAGRAALIPVLFGASVVVGCLIFYGSPRMRAPLEPLLVAWAAGGLVCLYGWARSRWLARGTE